MTKLEKFEYIHWLLSEVLSEDKTVFTDELDQSMQFLEELREYEFKRGL